MTHNKGGCHGSFIFCNRLDVSWLYFIKREDVMSELILGIVYILCLHLAGQVHELKKQIAELKGDKK